MREILTSTIGESGDPLPFLQTEAGYTVEAGISSEQLQSFRNLGDERLASSKTTDCRPQPKSLQENKVLYSSSFFKRKNKGKIKDCASLSPFSCGK
jgi:hypothetical protein